MKNPAKWGDGGGSPNLNEFLFTLLLVMCEKCLLRWSLQAPALPSGYTYDIKLQLLLFNKLTIPTERLFNNEIHRLQNRLSLVYDGPAFE